MKVSRVPNLVILGAPIGDLIFCAKFVAQKRADAAVLLSQLAEVGAEDPQVAFLLLRQCAAFCKLVHLARSAPPSHIAEGLALFDKDVRQCFAECTAVMLLVEWMQAQLSLSRGGLGLRSLSSHCVAAYLASISSSGCDKWNLLVEPIELFNGARLLSISSRHAASWLTVVPSPGLNLHLEPNEFQIAVKWWLDPLGHHALTCKHGGDVVLRHNSLRDVFVEFCHRACLGGQILVKNWHLGKPAAFDLTITSPLNPTTLTEAGVKCGSSAQVAEVRKHAANDGKYKMLDPLGHHATTCKRGGDVVFRHNKLRDILAETCRRAHLSVQVEAGCNLTPDHSHSRPADVLISNWVLGKTAACDLSVTSPLNSNIMSEAGVTAGAAAQATELRKHEANDVKCSELGWLCIPLVVESYGAWGKEAMESFSSLASRLAITSSRPKSAVLSELYGRLNLNLVRANAQLGLSYGGLGLRSISHHSCAAYIASLSFSGLGSADNPHLMRSIVKYNGLGLHLDPNELQIAVKWWLGLDTSRGSSCGLCPDVALDPLGHHAATCRHGGDVVIRHNRLRDVVLSFCHQAHIAARLEAGSGLTPGLDRARPADVLVRDWAQGKPAAFDITVTSPLTLLFWLRQVGGWVLLLKLQKTESTQPMTLNVLN
eukprot:Em0814g2a